MATYDVLKILSPLLNQEKLLQVKVSSNLSQVNMMQSVNLISLYLSGLLRIGLLLNLPDSPYPFCHPLCHSSPLFLSTSCVFLKGVEKPLFYHLFARFCRYLTLFQNEIQRALSYFRFGKERMRKKSPESEMISGLKSAIYSLSQQRIGALLS